MPLVGIKELQTMNDVSEVGFVCSGVPRQNGGNQFRNVMYSFMEAGQLPKEVLPLLCQAGFMQLLKSHVFKTVQPVWFWFTLCEAHRLAPSALVFWSHFRKELLYLSWFILLCRPFTTQNLSTLYQLTSPSAVLLVVSDLPLYIRY